MKSTLRLHAIFLVSALSLSGCGGSGSSSSAVEDTPNTTSSSSQETGPNTTSSSPKKTADKSSPAPPSSSGLSNSHVINPLRDLGLGKGETVCFRLKSYNNVTESYFSKAICSQISNDHTLTLSWSEVPGNITGYYVYFGTNKNNAANFLADVIVS